jgi:hypothetical protein
MCQPAVALTSRILTYDEKPKDRYSRTGARFAIACEVCRHLYDQQHNEHER